MPTIEAHSVTSTAASASAIASSALADIVTPLRRSEVMSTIGS